LTALVLGTETAARLNLTEATYDGFDPTGVCSVFAAAVAAGRILRLNESEMWNALALAFNRSGGSFQCNIDGSLAVRVIQGWVSQTGVHCAQLAKRGITGPKNFLDGVYGYFHLFGRDAVSSDARVRDLGQHFELQNVIFKKYPSCGLTLGCTDVTLALVEEKGLAPDAIDRVEVRVPPYAHKLVGHPFAIGDNPKVNAQFSIQYCVANALIRKRSRLRHFEEASVRDPEIMPLVEKISVIPDPALDARGHTALDLTVITRSGEEYAQKMDIAPGFPGNPLTREDHENHFWDCMDFADIPFPKERAEELLKTIGQVEDLEDVGVLIPILVI
jgi:2-methylcitrate dehydratase PrpD